MDKDEKKKEKVDEPVVEVDGDDEPEGCGHCCSSCHLHDEEPVDTDEK